MGCWRDRYHLRAARSNAQIIDLREGGFSSLGARANFAVAYGTKIENGTGGGGADTLYGNALGNVLRGGGGNDKLYAGSGSDQLFGDAGNDTLAGQAGTDRLTGGIGNDSFVFSEALGAANADRILDFSAVADTIRLAKSVFGALDPGSSMRRSSGRSPALVPRSMPPTASSTIAQRAISCTTGREWRGDWTSVRQAQCRPDAHGGGLHRVLTGHPSLSAPVDISVRPGHRARATPASLPCRSISKPATRP